MIQDTQWYHTHSTTATREIKSTCIPQPRETWAIFSTEDRYETSSLIVAIVKKGSAIAQDFHLTREAFYGGNIGLFMVVIS